MSSASRRREIPPKIDAEMTPAVRVFVESLLDQYEARFAELEAKLQKLTPRNSSIPPSTQHPHAKPKPPKPKGQKRKRGRQRRHTSPRFFPARERLRAVE